jgi:Malectin domain
MPLDANTQPANAERAELERVVEALAKWPRLSQLLRYMGEKLLAGDVDHLNEYNIATEVLGRSKTVFNAAEDAIARVEAHRLRKRLATFYETEGRDHQIQVTLPAGSYVPVFVHKPAEKPSPTPPDLPQASQAESGRQEARQSNWFIPGWKSLIIAAILAFAALGFYLYRHTVAHSTGAMVGNIQAPVSTVSTSQSAASSAAIRLLAGYNGPPRTDSAGRIWSPDRYFSGGDSWQHISEFMARTSDPFLFEHSRTGDFAYNIPLKPGSYELHLYFSTPVRSIDALFTFNVWINDELVLPGFDINDDAMGIDIADEHVFRDVSPGKDGMLRIKFASATGPATLNALEILPTANHAQLPIRLIMQTTPLTDHKGQTWYPDDYFMNGRLSNQTHPLTNSPDPDLFSQERYGHFTYAIPVDKRDTYTLVLHFVEFYFTAPASGGNGRVFKVMCDGQTLLDNFDIYKEAGSLHEVTKTFHHLKPSAQGKLNITFEPIVNNATVSGIEVLDESQ